MECTFLMSIVNFCISDWLGTSQFFYRGHSFSGNSSKYTYILCFKKGLSLLQSKSPYLLDSNLEKKVPHITRYYLVNILRNIQGP